MSEQSTFQYFIGKRIDKLEETLQQQIDDRFDSLEKTIDTHLARCMNTRSKFDVRVGKLEGFRNRAVGAAALLLVLLSVWKVAG